MLEVRGIIPGPLLLALDFRDKLECTGLASPLDLNSAAYQHAYTFTLILFTNEKITHSIQIQTTPVIFDVQV